MNKKEKLALGIVAGVGVAGVLAVAMSSGSSSSRPSPSPGPSPSPDPVDPFEPEPSPGPSPGPGPSPSDTEVKNIIGTWCAAWDIDPLIRDFLICTAWGESGLNPRVMLGTYVPPSAVGLSPAVRIPSTSTSLREGEASASRVAWNRNQDWYAGCGNDPRDYQAGSYGLFGMIPSNGLACWWNTSRQCTNPVEIFSIGGALITAFGFMARVSAGGYGWREQGQTMGDMRVAWRRPSAVDEGDTEANLKTKGKMTKAIAANFPGKYTNDTWMPSIPNNPQRFAQMMDQWLDTMGPIR